MRIIPECTRLTMTYYVKFMERVWIGKNKKTSHTAQYIR